MEDSQLLEMVGKVAKRGFQVRQLGQHASSLPYVVFVNYISQAQSVYGYSQYTTEQCFVLALLQLNTRFIDSTKLVCPSDDIKCLIKH